MKPPANTVALRFLATGRDRCGATLGVLVDASGVRQHLLVASDGHFSLSHVLPAGQEPVLLYESTVSVVCGGAPNPDGSISYQGASYRIESSLDRSGWTARVRGD